jgi:hypothetical protein
MVYENRNGNCGVPAVAAPFPENVANSTYPCGNALRIEIGTGVIERFKRQFLLTRRVP